MAVDAGTNGAKPQRAQPNGRKERFQMLLEQINFQALPGLLSLGLGYLELGEKAKQFAEAIFSKPG